MRKRSLNGILLVLGIFALGGVVYWGLWLGKPPASPAAPQHLPWAAPQRALMLVSVDLERDSRPRDEVVQTIRALDPDFVLLQNIERRDIVQWAAALGMQQHFHPLAYQRAVNVAGRKATFGSLILSAHPIYEAGAVTSTRDEIFAVRAVAVVDEARFLIASGHLEQREHELGGMIAMWQARDSGPVVVALSSPASADALRAVGNFLISQHWSVEDESPPGQKLSWLSLKRAI